LEDALERERMWKKLRDKMEVIWRQPSAVQNMTVEKQSQNMERIIYFVRMITNDARYTRVIKSGWPGQKQHSTRTTLFSSAN